MRPLTRYSEWKSLKGYYKSSSISEAKYKEFEPCLNLRCMSSMVGSSWNCIQCFEIWSGAQFEPVFDGSAMRCKLFEFGLRIPDPEKDLIIIFLPRSQNFRRFELIGVNHCSTDLLFNSSLIRYLMGYIFFCPG